MTILTTKEAIKSLNTDKVLGVSEYIPTWEEYSILMKVLMIESSVERVIVYGIGCKDAFIRNACTEKTVKIITRPDAMMLTEEKEIIKPLIGEENIRFGQIVVETSFRVNGTLEKNTVVEAIKPEYNLDRVIMIQTKSTCEFSYPSIADAPKRLDEITDTLHVFIPSNRQMNFSTPIRMGQQNY